MRIVIALIILMIIADSILGAPPIAGGFMTGNQSARYIVWYHPELYVYEQGRDGENDELNLTPGDEPVPYTVVQKAGFPICSYLDLFRIKINPDDIYPDLPGDQYSLFGYSVYLDGNDGYPQQPCVRHGDNRLCNGIPCGEQWVNNTVDWLNLEGKDLWFGFDWADSTPAAPQIKCLFLPQAEDYNCLGIKTGEFYDWQAISYTTVFRYRFLSPFPVDTQVASGWRRSVENSGPPDSFSVRCFNTSGDSPAAHFYIGPDTLMTRLPDEDIDSVEIAACYDNCLEDSTLVLVYDEQLAAPVSAEVDFEKEPGTGSFDLIVNNTGLSLLNLTLSGDRSVLVNLPDEIILEGNQTLIVPVETRLSESDSLDLLIIIRDRDRQFYPYLVKVKYPPQTPLDAVDEEINSAPRQTGFSLYPNPFQNIMKIRPERYLAADRIEIFNVIGQKVYEKRIEQGRDIMWDGCDMSGRPLPAGIYFVRVKNGESTGDTRKVVIVR